MAILEKKKKKTLNRSVDIVNLRSMAIISVSPFQGLHWFLNERCSIVLPLSCCGNCLNFNSGYFSFRIFPAAKINKCEGAHLRCKLSSYLISDVTSTYKPFSYWISTRNSRNACGWTPIKHRLSGILLSHKSSLNFFFSLISLKFYIKIKRFKSYSPHG